MAKAAPFWHLISVAQTALQTKKTPTQKNPTQNTHPLPKLPLTSVLFKNICSVSGKGDNVKFYFMIWKRKMKN